MRTVIAVLGDLTLAGSPVLPPLRLTGGFCHADWTLPRQDVNSPFSPCMCHPGVDKGVCTHASSEPSRVRRGLLMACLGGSIPLATISTSLIHNMASNGKSKQVHQKRLWIREFDELQFQYLLSLLADHEVLR